MSAENPITELLAKARNGDAEAAKELVARVNDELRRIAKRLFSAEPPGHTLQPTAIVNEAWFKMLGSDDRLNLPELESRSHFYALAARVMRRFLVDYARGQDAAKRGGGQTKMSIRDDDQPSGPREADVVDIHDALERLNVIRPRVAQVVELQFFGGCTVEVTATALGVSPDTVKKDRAYAKAWLQRELEDYA